MVEVDPFQLLNLDHLRINHHRHIAISVALTGYAYLVGND
jgi:hypothetical protein